MVWKSEIINQLISLVQPASNQFFFFFSRVDQFKQAVDKQSTFKTDALTQHHEHLVMEKGPQTLEDVK